ERRGQPRALAEDARLAALRQRCQRILRWPLEYRVCRGFKRLHLERPLLPVHARAIGERTLLGAEQEADLFLRLNYCKFRADILRRQLPREAPSDESLAAAPLLA